MGPMTIHFTAAFGRKHSESARCVSGSEKMVVQCVEWNGMLDPGRAQAAEDPAVDAPSVDEPTVDIAHEYSSFRPAERILER